MHHEANNNHFVEQWVTPRVYNELHVELLMQSEWSQTTQTKTARMLYVFTVGLNSLANSKPRNTSVGVARWNWLWMVTKIPGREVPCIQTLRQWPWWNNWNKAFSAESLSLFVIKSSVDAAHDLSKGPKLRIGLCNMYACYYEQTSI